MLWAGFIFYLSSIPGRELVAPFPYFDKCVHAFVYSVLAFFTVRALACRIGRVNRTVMLMAIFIAGLYGASDEFHQLFVPGRSPDAMDVLADLCGAALGVWAYLRFNRWLLNRLRSTPT